MNIYDECFDQLALATQENLRLKDQRDELLAALRMYQGGGIGNSTDFQLQAAAAFRAAAAIAKYDKAES